MGDDKFALKWNGCERERSAGGWWSGVINYGLKSGHVFIEGLRRYQLVY